MTPTSTSTAVAAVELVFTQSERFALAGFLAGYTGLTREAYALDLRQYASWCQHHQIRLFQARRAGIECFAHDLEARGRARATITRRLCTIAVAIHPGGRVRLGSESDRFQRDDGWGRVRHRSSRWIRMRPHR